MVRAMCMGYVVVVLSLWTPSFATMYAILLPVRPMCAPTLWMEILDGNLVWGPIYLVYDWCYE